MKMPAPVRRRRLLPGRAVFNAAAELCRVKHPDELHQGHASCGECYDLMAQRLDNPVTKNRYYGLWPVTTWE